MPESNQGAEETQEWGKLSGHDFREDIPPSFEWWRKYVYEPKHIEIESQISGVNAKIDNTVRLLWGLLMVFLTGEGAVIALLIHR